LCQGRTLLAEVTITPAWQTPTKGTQKN